MNVCILSLTRTGSTYMYDVLKQSPEFNNYFFEPIKYNMVEPSLYKNIFNNKRYIDFCYKKLDDLAKVANEKNVLIKEPHAIADYEGCCQEYENFVKLYFDFLESNFRIIKLIRNNIFESTLSLMIGIKRNRFVEYKKENLNRLSLYEKVKYIIDLKDFEQTIKSRVLNQKKLVSYAKNYSTIFYENMTIDNIMKSSGLEIFNVQEKLLPLKLKDKKDVVLNYNELKNWYEANKNFLL